MTTFKKEFLAFLVLYLFTYPTRNKKNKRKQRKRQKRQEILKITEETDATSLNIEFLTSVMFIGWEVNT